MNDTKVTKDMANKTLIIERTFDAPKEKLWQAYADKEKFEAWWGPEGWQTTTKSFDFKPGGRIHYCMKCVDENQGEWYGQESWGLMELTSIDEPHGFTATDFFCSADGTTNKEMPAQKFSVEFIEEDGKTRMINKSISESVEDLEKLVEMGMVEGFSSQLDKLEVMLTN